MYSMYLILWNVKEDHEIYCGPRSALDDWKNVLFINSYKLVSTFQQRSYSQKNRFVSVFPVYTY